LNNDDDFQVKLYESNDFEFPVDLSDTILTITVNKTMNNKGVKNLFSKIVIIKEFNLINLDEISKLLAVMGINKLNILSVDNKVSSIVNKVTTNKGCYVSYIELTEENFIKYLNGKSTDFLSDNKDNLYIIRKASFLHIKNLFATINNCGVNLGRGGSQKAHILSPLDLRLSFYLLAMFNLNYTLVRNLNTFNHLAKERYLSYTNKYSANKYKVFTPIKVDTMYKYNKEYLENY
jgi:hypothetical protein